MNEHEQRQEDKRQRYLDLAEKAEAAIEPINTTFQQLNACMNGQPILVGHHSEKRHRRDLDRQDKRLSRMVELDKKAKYYRDKAAGVGTGGISSDDTDAIDKLAAKLAGRETLQARMKAVNSAHRAYLKNPASMDTSKLSDDDKALVKMYQPAYSWEPHPFPPYRLSNNNANIKRIKTRIAELEKASDQTTTETEQSGVKVVENAEENRIQLIFDGKPSDEVRQSLKRHGFRWSRRNTAWQRHLNNNGRWAVKRFFESYTS